MWLGSKQVRLLAKQLAIILKSLFDITNSQNGFPQRRKDAKEELRKSRFELPLRLCGNNIHHCARGRRRVPGDQIGSLRTWGLAVPIGSPPTSIAGTAGVSSAPAHYGGSDPG